MTGNQPLAAASQHEGLLRMTRPATGNAATMDLLRLLESLRDGGDAACSGPMLVPGAIYSRNQIVTNFGISENTLKLWVSSGLLYYKPGTRNELFLADEVIAFIRKHPRLRHPRRSATGAKMCPATPATATRRALPPRADGRFVQARRRGVRRS